MSRTFDEIVLAGLRARVAELERENAVLAAQNANFRTVLESYKKDYDDPRGDDIVGMAAMALEMPPGRIVALYRTAIALADLVTDEGYDYAPYQSAKEAYESGRT